MKKIYLSAYCRCNLGDDLFVLTMLRRYPQVQFYLFADRRQCGAFCHEPNLHIASPLKYRCFELLRKLRLTNIQRVHCYHSRHADGAVKIGGSIFIEPPNWTPSRSNLSFDYYIGANFGPYQSEAFLESVRWRLQNARDCCFRDSYSCDVFFGLGNARYAPDVLFGYPYFPVRQKGRGIGISMISLDNRPELAAMKEHYYDTLAKLCDCCDRQNISVTLFSFCRAEGDERAAADICSRTPANVRICNYRGDVETFLNELNSCECLLATRFHAMVLGWCLGKRVLPIVYSRKQTHVIQDVNFSGKCWDLLGGEKWDAEELLRDCMTNERLNVTNLAVASNAQFQGLDKFVSQEAVE